MVTDLSATTMLHIIDNFLPASALPDLRDLCDIHWRLKEEHDADACIAAALWELGMDVTSPKPCAVDISLKANVVILQTSSMTKSSC